MRHQTTRLARAKSLAVALTLLAATASARTGPVAFYPFDGDAADASGYGNHATVFEALPTTDRLGQPGSAYAFDGQNDKISVPANPELDITDAITLTVWVRSLETKSQILIRKGGAVTAPYALQLAGNNTIGFTMTIDGTPTGIFKNGYALDEWIFLAATWDGTTMKLYENAVEVATGTHTGTLDTNTSSLLIGTRLQLPADTLNGDIDAATIWNRALTPSEIETVMIEGATPVAEASWGSLKATFGGE